MNRGYSVVVFVMPLEDLFSNVRMSTIKSTSCHKLEKELEDLRSEVDYYKNELGMCRSNAQFLLSHHSERQQELPSLKVLLQNTSSMLEDHRSKWEELLLQWSDRNVTASGQIDENDGLPFGSSIMWMGIGSLLILLVIVLVVVGKKIKREKF